MNKTWIVIAHRAGARIFENDGPGKGIGHVDAIAHPEGRLENKALGSDKPRRSFDTHGPGRHALGKNTTRRKPSRRSSRTRWRRGSTPAAQSMPTGNWCWWPSRARHAARCALAADGGAGERHVDRDLGGIADRDLPSHLSTVV